MRYLRYSIEIRHPQIFIIRIRIGIFSFMTLRYYLIISALLLHLSSYGQDTLKVTHYGVEQGLPQSSVWSIAQDDFGFLWISTADGLCRYDGYDFHQYRHREEDSISINTNRRVSLLKSKSGDVWINHENGIDQYHSVTGKFSHPVIHQTPSTLIKRFLKEDDEGNLWSWSAYNGLYKINSSGTMVTNFIPQNELAPHKDLAATDGVIDRNGKIWITQDNEEILVFDPQIKNFHTVNFGIRSTSLQIVSDSIILIGTPQGLIRFNSATQSKTTIPYLVPNAYTACIFKFAENIYWVGTDQGIFQYNDIQRSVSHHYILKSGSDRNYSYAYAMHKDHSGNIWIGTNGDGLKKYHPNQLPFQYYTAPSAKGQLAKSIYADENKVFVGYYDNGIDVFDRSKGVIKKIRHSKEAGSLPSDWVYSLTPVLKNKLFIQCIGNRYDVGLLDMNSYTFASLGEPLKSIIRQTKLSNNYPTAFKLNDHRVLFNYANLLIEANFTESDASYKLIKEFPDLITAIYVDQDSVLWIGTEQGGYHQIQQQWRKWNYAQRHHIKSFCEDANDHVWIATTEGILIANERHELVNTLNASSGLVNEFVYGILRDGQQNMWFSHNKGLTRYDHGKKTFKHFTHADGLQSDEFNTGAYFKSATGELFFGGIQGTNSFYPEQITDNPVLAQPRITAIRVFDQPLRLDAVPWATRHIELVYTQNQISFDFVGMEYTNPIKNQYRYRLAGTNNNWIDAGINRTINFANLAAGQYTFEVLSSNNDGVWNNLPTQLRITIIPPFWKTIWFRIAVILFISLSIAGFTFILSRGRYKRKMKALELEQKVQHERERLSRELHDNLGSQLSQLATSMDDALQHDPPSTTREGKLLHAINKSTREIINDLRVTMWAINKPRITFAEFADKLKLTVHRLQQLNEVIKINYAETLDSSSLSSEEALSLLRICQEAAANAIQHSKCTTINIVLHVAHEHYEIRIEDNGIGFETTHRKEGHYGLDNMHIRAKEIGTLLTLTAVSPGGTIVRITK